MPGLISRRCFADVGIVCVTVAYRLGVLGFLDVEPLLGAQYAGGANNALRDLIEGLGWVKEHVADFGGDPSRVTVGGESAGAKLTDILMGVRSAQGLFHQMISESGGAERVWSREDSEKVAKGFGAAWENVGGRKSLMEALGAALMDAQTRFLATWPQHFPLRAEIDGTLLPRLPVATIAQGSTRGKRLLLGTNKEESAAFIGPHPTKDASAGDLGNLPLAKFAEVYVRHGALYPEMPVELRRIRAVTAEEYWIPSMRVLDAHVRGGGTAWDYRLDFAEASGRMQGLAYHALDTEMVWAHPHGEVGNAPAESALSAQMHAAWAAFIRGEAPTAPGLPVWPEYKSDTRATMILDAQSRVELRPCEAEFKAWDGVL